MERAGEEARRGTAQRTVGQADRESLGAAKIRHRRLSGMEPPTKNPDVLSITAIRAALDGCKADLQRLGGVSLAVFGSVARNESTPDSDVDVLVEFRGDATLARYMDLKALLEHRLSRRVDLVTQKELSDRIRPTVERDAVRVA